MEAVIFDMDGVLVDSELQWKLAGRAVFKRLMPGWKDADYERTVGLGVADLHRFLVEEHGLEEPWEGFVAACDGLAEEVYARRASLAPGLDGLLDDLARAGVPVGLASGSPSRWIRRVLERFELGGRFKAVVSVDEAGGLGKPDPAVYRRAAELLGARPPLCVAIEDSERGVLAAKRAGMVCVGLRNGSNDGQDLSRADLEARGLTGLDAAALRRLTVRPAAEPPRPTAATRRPAAKP